MMILGVDPGGTYTGAVLRNGDDLVDATTFTRPAKAANKEWVDQLIESLDKFTAEHGDYAVAVEDLVDPSRGMGGQRASLGPSFFRNLGRATLSLGAVLGVYPNAHVVRPNGNGSAGKGTYPKALTGIRPKHLTPSAGCSTRDHERSAWDVAGKHPRLRA